MWENWSQPARIDRDLQRQLLKEMAKVYPRKLEKTPLGRVPYCKEMLANLLYLKEHRLCDVTVDSDMGDPLKMKFRNSRITAAGLDFLEQDGGLKAILSVVTIRFETETLRALLNSRVDETDMPEEEKSKFREHLNALPETALKAGMTDLVTTGLKHLPDAAHWLRTLVGL